MRGIGGYEGKKGSFFRFARFDPTQCLLKEYIRTESFCPDCDPVMIDHRIEIPVFSAVNWIIGTTAFKGLAYSSGTMNENFRKSPVPGLVGFFITQVPFTEYPGAVTRFFQ
jgi:hypothetical protein